MYDSLLEWDPHTQQQPALASRGSIKDPRTVDFTLRKGVKFHNGQELTSADVVYSIQQQMNPPAPGSTGTLSFFPAIVGVERGEQVRRAGEAVEAGRQPLRLVRVEPLVGDRPEQPVPADQPGHAGHRHAGRSSSSSTSRTTTSPTRSGDQYWKTALPYLDGIQLKIIPDEQTAIAALQAGALDGATISAANAQALNGNSKVTVLKGQTAGFYELQFTSRRVRTSRGPTSASARRSTWRSTATTDPEGPRGPGPVLGARAARLRAVAVPAGRRSRPSTRSTT